MPKRAGLADIQQPFFKSPVPISPVALALALLFRLATTGHSLLTRLAAFNVLGPAVTKAAGLRSRGEDGEQDANKGDEGDDLHADAETFTVPLSEKLTTIQESVGPTKSPGKKKFGHFFRYFVFFFVKMR